MMPARSTSNSETGIRKEKSRVANLRLVFPAVSVLACCSLATAPTVSPAGDSVTIQLVSRLETGNRRTQAAIAPWSAADIHHLRVSLHLEEATSSGGSPPALRPVQVEGVPVVADLPQAHLDDPVRFTGLRRNSVYVAQAQAYRTAESVAEGLISVDDLSRLRMPVAMEDRLVMGTLPVQFKDRVFAGEATPGIEFLGGGLVPADALTVVHLTPSPTLPVATFRTRPAPGRR